MRDLLIPALFGISTVLTLLYYTLLRRYLPSAGELLSLKFFLPIWLVLFTLEFFFLGSNSYINMNSEGNLAVTMDHYLAQNDDDERFAHRFGGGQDQYVWFPGKQYLNPQKWLLQILPLWLVIEFHKLMVGALGFMGSYFLAKRAAPISETLAIAIAAVYPVSHIYLNDFSTSFGTGFAAIPLAVYWCIGCTGSKHYWWLVAVSAMILSIADPIKVFPAVFVAFVAGSIFLEDFNLRRVIVAFFFCVVTSILNWHELLFALANTASLIGRGFDTIEISTPPLEAIRETLRTMVIYWIPSLFFTFSFTVLFVRKDRKVLTAAITGGWVVLSIIIADAFPWEIINLSFLNRLSHQQYMILAMGTVGTLVTARAFANVDKLRWQLFPRLNLYPPLIIMAIALGVMTFNKGYNFTNLMFVGGQNVFKGIDSLANPLWKPKPGFRTVTFYEAPPSNIVAGFYGYEAFDGQLNLNNHNWARYWLAVIYENKNHNQTTRLGWYWKFWNGKSYDVEKHVRLDLLAAANVRYLFSPLPLASKSLKLLHAPAKDQWIKVRPDFFKSYRFYLIHRLKRVFDAGDVFVYELPSALPRAFAVSEVISIPDFVNQKEILEAIPRAAKRKAVVANKAVAERLGSVRTLEVRKITTVKDGYNISIHAPEGGILAVNQSPFVFWRAYDQNGHHLQPEQVSVVNMAVAVAPGTRCVYFRYERQLLRERLFINQKKNSNVTSRDICE
jgi:hypothetical protein